MSEINVIPKPGAFYRHFKGDLYFIIGLARYSCKYRLTSTEVFVLYTSDILKFIQRLTRGYTLPVKHSETEEILTLYCENGSWLLMPSTQQYDQAFAWIRELNNFKEIISKEEGTFYHRFDLIANTLQELVP